MTITSTALVLTVQVTMDGSANCDGKQVAMLVGQLAAQLPAVQGYEFALNLSAVAESPPPPAEEPTA